MFSFTNSPADQFTPVPMPAEFFEIPDPFRPSAVLILKHFLNNSADLRPEHMQGILIAPSKPALR